MVPYLLAHSLVEVPVTTKIVRSLMRKKFIFCLSEKPSACVAPLHNFILRSVFSSLFHIPYRKERRQGEKMCKSSHECFGEMTCMCV